MTTMKVKEGVISYYFLGWKIDYLRLCKDLSFTEFESDANYELFTPHTSL